MALWERSKLYRDYWIINWVAYTFLFNDDLEDPKVKAEYEKGYQVAGAFFEKHL